MSSSSKDYYHSILYKSKEEFVYDDKQHTYNLYPEWKLVTIAGTKKITY